MSDDDSQDAMWVECKACKHRWIGLYLPQPIRDAARIMKNLTCPKCAAGSREIVIFDGSTPA